MLTSGDLKSTFKSAESSTISYVSSPNSLYSSSSVGNKNNNKFTQCGAYAKTSVDKIGAGDSMLSLIALCLKCGFHKELALIISSFAAAQSVMTIGNKETINKTKILKSLENILK